MEIKFNITIDDRIINFFKRTVTKRNFLIFLAVTMVGSTIFLFGAQISQLNTFTAGDIISSQAVNTNFNDLLTESNDQDTRITALETQVPALANGIFYPAGVNGTYGSSPTSGLSLTVPAGKVWYIFNVSVAGATTNFEINGCDAGNIIAGGSIDFIPPLIVEENATLKGTANDITFNYLEFDSTAVKGISVNLFTGNATVPVGKKWILYYLFTDDTANLAIDSIPIIQFSMGMIKALNPPLILPAGKVLSLQGAGTPTYANVFGYEVTE